jgi:hypothetical protein
MRPLVLPLALSVLVVAAGGALAAPYKNTTFQYQVDLPEGIGTTAPPTAPIVPFSCQGIELTAKLAVAAKPAPMGETDLARYKAQDEAAIKEKSTGYKPLQVTGPDVTGKPATHYGFAFKDKKGAVYVARFVLFHRSIAGSHTWVKGQALYPRANLAAGSKAFDQLLTSFRWIDPPAPATPESSAPSTPTPAPSRVSTIVTPPEPSRGPVAPAELAGGGKAGYEDYFKKRMKKMDPKEAAAFHKSFEGGGNRTEAEEKRAREFGIGGILKPVEK